MDYSGQSGRVVIEDEPLVALEIVASLTKSGDPALSAHRVADAVRSIDKVEISGSLVGGQDCSPLRRHRQIPIVFYTGDTAAPAWSQHQET